MWRLLKKIFSRPEPPPVEPDGEVIRFDDAGFTRSSHLIRTMGWRQHWRWEEITAFGFAFSPSMFPDPWFGDYMESQWFITVAGQNGPEHIYFDMDWLDINHLPDAFLQQMPELDLDELRRGLDTAAVGFHNYEGEGRWIGWQRTKPKRRRRRVAKITAPAKTTKRESRAK